VDYKEYMKICLHGLYSFLMAFSFVFMWLFVLRRHGWLFFVNGPIFFCCGWGIFEKYFFCKDITVEQLKEECVGVEMKKVRFTSEGGLVDEC
jgi:hypothetical protein